MLAPGSLDARVEELSRSLDDLRRRLERVEDRIDERSGVASELFEARDADARRRSEAAEAAERSREGRTLPEELTYAGRILLVLGGAYLLRAITEAGTVAPALGIALGLLYGALWIALAWRAAGRDLTHSAVAHGIAAAAVGLPLVWETTVRFGLLSPPLGAVLLFGYLAALYVVAWHRDLRALAWIAGAGGVAAALATMFGSSTLPPFIGVLVLLGGLALASEPTRGWQPLSWVTAGVADLGVLLLSLGTSLERSGVDPATAIWSQLLLPAVYLSLFGVLAVRGHRPIDLFAIVQGAAATLLGLGGAMAALERVPGFTLLLGFGVLVAALVSYGVAFRVVDRARRRPFHYFGTLGTILALFGTELLLARPELVWTLLVPLAAFAAWRLRRLSLGLHAALFALAAAWGSDLVTDGLRTFAAPAGTSWERPGLGALAIVAATIVALGFPGPDSPYQGRFRGAASLVFLTIAVWGLGDLAIRLGAVVLGIEPGAGADPGALAALRTAVLAAAAVGLAWASRLHRLSAARWLVYPVLVAGGLKLVAEDLMAGRAATLVLSFLAYGTALIVAPRLVGRRSPAADLAGEDPGRLEEAP